VLCFNSILNIPILDFTPILGILLAIYLILVNLFILCYLVLALGKSLASILCSLTFSYLYPTRVHSVLSYLMTQSCAS
jgi:hypothetical protein